MAAQLDGEAFSLLAPCESVQTRARGARLFERGIFCATVALIPLAAIPYGTVEEWWEALFQCLVFALAALWVIEGLLRGRWLVREHRLLVPLVPLLGFIFLQTVPLGTVEAGGSRVLRTLSADAYETRLVAFRLLALILFAGLLLRYASSRRRLRALVYVVLGVGGLSAVFGLVREVMHQDGQGFLLRHLQPQIGYGQFVNNNHFALLMEMTLGLALGLLTGGGKRRGGQFFFCLAACTLVWSALVLSGSRGGVFGMIGQVLFLILLLNRRRARRRADNASGPRGALYTLLARSATVAGLALVIALGVVWLGGEKLVRRMENLSGEVSTEGAGNRAFPRRTEMWRATWQMFKEHPVAGIGFGGYWVAIDSRYDAAGGSVPQQAHNEYLEILASGGLVALAPAAWFVVAFVRRARARLPARRSFRRAALYGALTGLCAVALHSFVDFGLHVTVNALVCTALFVIAAAHIRKDEHAAAADGEESRPAPPASTDSASHGRPHATARVCIAVVCLLACPLAVGTTARAGLSRWYTLRPGRDYSLVAADEALRLSPSDPAARFFRASLLSAQGNLGEALAGFERAVALRPQDHLLWINLGFLRDRNGDLPGAIAAFREAVRHAPYYGQPRWQLGNLLLRAGQRELACAELARAAESDPTLFEPLLELLWQVSGRDADALTRTASPQTAAAKLALARFLIQHGETPTAAALLREAGSAAVGERRRLVAALLAEKRFVEAHELWSDGRGRHDGSELRRDVTITDGGFEEMIKTDEPGFGWHVAGKVGGVIVALDPKNARSGARSLRLDFKGEAPAGTALVSQLILTEAERRYRMRFATLTQELTSNGPPVVVLLDATDGQPLAPPFSLPLSSNGWQDYTIDFATKAATRAVTLELRRQDCAALPCLLFGQVWLDDFSLQKL